MPKVSYDSKRGLVQEAGSGVNFTADSIVFSTLPATSTQAITTTLSSITSPGSYTVAGTSGALTTLLPDPSAIPGGTIVVRGIGTARAHILTGSAASAGINIFAGALAGPRSEGQKITFPGAATGESVALISDGRAYLLMGVSGSMTISS